MTGTIYAVLYGFLKIGFLGELLCFWLRSSFILHVKLMVGGAAPELLHKSGAKGVSLEGKFG